MRRVPLLLLSLGLCLGPPSDLGAQAPSESAAAPPAQPEIAARAAALLAQDPPQEVRAPLEQAQIGLARAASAHKLHDGAAEQRALEIARAGLALAEARSALLRERALLAAAERRGEQSRRRNQANLKLLEKAGARLREAPAAAAREPDAGAHAQQSDAGERP